MVKVIKGYSVVSSTRGFVAMYVSMAYAKADVAKLSEFVDWGTITIKPTIVEVASSECAECGDDVAEMYQATHACSRLV